MQALTAIAATAYALTLWMFAPRTVWEREVKQAKQNRQNRLTATPEPITETEEPTPQSEAKPEAIPEAIEQAIPTPQGTDYITWTTAKLREEAKQRKLQWRPLINGKRKPLNKPQLIELLTA